MPDTTKDRGIVGESFKEVWIGEVMSAEYAEHMAALPKGAMLPHAMLYEPPWTSLGQAPSASQIEASSYGGST